MREHDRNNGVNPKTRADEKTKELTGWEVNSSVSFLYSPLLTLMMDTQSVKLPCGLLVLSGICLMSCQKQH